MIAGTNLAHYPSVSIALCPFPYSVIMTCIITIWKWAFSLLDSKLPEGRNHVLLNVRVIEVQKTFKGWFFSLRIIIYNSGLPNDSVEANKENLFYASSAPFFPLTPHPERAEPWSSQISTLLLSTKPFWTAGTNAYAAFTWRLLGVRECSAVSVASDSATPWTVNHPPPLSGGSSHQEYLSGSPHPPPEDLADPGIEPVSVMSPALAGRFFTSSAIWEVELIPNGGTSLAVQWLRLCLPMQGVWVQSLLGMLRAHMLHGQKTKP